MKRVYLSGPMSGIKDWNFPKFHAVAAHLRDPSFGLEVVSPAELNPDTSMSWEACLRDDIKHLCDCDAIVLLEGWEKSKGAHLELQVAHRLGMEILFERDFA